MRTLPTSCPYSFEQIQSSEVFPAERMAELAKFLKETPVKALKPDGSEIQTLLIVPTTKGESAFIVENENSRTYMEQCMLPTILTAEEQEALRGNWRHSQDEARFNRRLKEARTAGKFHLASKWGGGVFYNEEYYSAIGDLYDILADVPSDEVPLYIYAASPRRVIPEIDFSELVDDHIENNGWEDMSSDDLSGVAELEAALAAFGKANAGITSFWEDTSTVIEIDDFTPTPE
jgi:hypothetical protein